MNTFGPEVEQFFKELVMHNPIKVSINEFIHEFTRNASIKPLFPARTSPGETLYVYDSENKLKRSEVYEIYTGEINVSGMMFPCYVYEFVEANMSIYYDMGQNFNYARTAEQAKELHLGMIDYNVRAFEEHINQLELVVNGVKMDKEKIEAEFIAKVEEFKEEDQQDVIDDEFDNADGSPDEYHGYVKQGD